MNTHDEHGMNINLLDDTIESIRDAGHVTDDVEYVGSADGAYRLDWNGFVPIAKSTWYGGYHDDDYTEIAYDLIVMFKDGSMLTREWQPESESYWVYRNPAPSAFKEFTTVGTYEDFYVEKDTVGDLNK
jgi:hypothetical protein